MNPSPTRRLGLALILIGLAAATSGSEFRGCEGAPRTAPAPLPTSSGGCAEDTDCTSTDMCVAMMCVLGECVPTDARRDRDLDGYAEAPCGIDCNDTDNDVHPDAAERCDGVDQDCDSVVDEHAVGLDPALGEHNLRAASLVAVGNTFWVVGVQTDGVETRIAVQQVGDTEPPTVVLSGLAGNLVAIDADSDGRHIVVVFVMDANLPQRIAVDPGAPPALVEGPSDLGADGDVSALDFLIADAQEWLLYDTGPQPRRLLWRSRNPESAPQLYVGPGSPPVLVTNGAQIAAVAGPDTLALLDFDGVLTATPSVPGVLSEHGVAPGDAFFYVSYRDETGEDFLGRVDTDGLTGATLAPGSAADPLVEIFGTADFLLVTRRGGNGISAWALDAPLRTTVATFPSERFSLVAGSPSRVTFATDDSGLSAVLTSHDDGGSTFVQLRCP